VPGLAGHLQLHRLPAVAVPEQDRGAVRSGRVLVAPLHQPDQYGIQVQALLGEAVLVTGALATVLIRHLAQQSFLHQAAEPVAEHLPGDPGPVLHVCEPAHAVERLAQHEERRPLADDPHRSADRAVGGVVVHDPGTFHGPRLNLVDRLSNWRPC
jgi:hypothetical protein